MNALVLEYAREARGYTLLALVSVVSVLLFVIAVHRRSRLVWGAWVLATTFGVYVHWFAGYVAVAEVVSIAFLPASGAVMRQLVPAYCSAWPVLCTPLGLIMLGSGAPGTGWIAAPTADALPAMLVAIAGGAALTAAGYVVAVLFGVIRSVMNPAPSHWPVALMGLWILVPLAGSYFVSFMVPMFISRYLIVVVPALAILAAVGLAYLRTTLMVPTFAVLVLGSTLSTAFTLDSIHHEDWRSAAATVLAATRPGDGIVFYSSAVRQPFEYYVERTGRTPPDPVFPPGPWDEGRPLAGRTDISAASAVEAALPSRLWLVFSHAPASAERQRLEDAVEAHYSPVREYHFDVWVTIELYKRRPVAAR